MFRREFVFLTVASAVGLSCGAPRLQASIGPETCDNKLDDNGDGKVDCSDPKCFDNAKCQGLMELCTNGVDDNSNGRVDCGDPLCAGESCGDDCTCVNGTKVYGNQGGGAGGGEAGTGGGAPGTGGGTPGTGGGTPGTGGGTPGTGGGTPGTGGGTPSTGGGTPSTGGGTPSTGGGSAVDQTPDAFSFADVANASALATVTSNTITPTGFSGPLVLSCTGCAGLAKNGVFGGTALSGVMPGDTIAVRATAGASGATVTVPVSLGLTSTVWSVTTRTPGYAWNASGWSACSNLCGSGTQTRTVTCRSDDGNPAVDSLCVSAKPATSQNCTSSTGCSSCAKPWGGTVAHNSSVTAYSEALPLGPCVSQTRTCNNGTLSGTYTAQTCAAGCSFSSSFIASGSSVDAYYVRFGTHSQPCEHPATKQVRTCNNGTLSGTYTWRSCINYPCTDNGAAFMDQNVNFPSSTYTVRAASLSCYGPSGTWLNAVIYNGPESGACQWGTRWHVQTVCGYMNGVAYRCFAGAWTAVGSGTNGCPQAP